MKNETVQFHLVITIAFLSLLSCAKDDKASAPKTAIQGPQSSGKAERPDSTATSEPIVSPLPQPNPPPAPRIAPETEAPAPNGSQVGLTKQFLSFRLNDNAPLVRVHVGCTGELPGVDLANQGILLLPDTKLYVANSKKQVICAQDPKFHSKYGKELGHRAHKKLKIGERIELEALMLVEKEQRKDDPITSTRKLEPQSLKVSCLNDFEDQRAGLQIGLNSKIMLDTVLVEKNKSGERMLRAGTLVISCEAKTE